MQLARTIRQSHLAKDCPGFANAISRELDTAFEGFFGALDSIATKHGLNSREFIRHIDGRGSDEAYEEWMQETWEPLTESGPQ